MFQPFTSFPGNLGISRRVGGGDLGGFDGLEAMDDVLTTCTAINMHAS